MLTNIAEVKCDNGLKFSADEFSGAFTITVSSDFGDIAEIMFELETGPENILKYQDTILYKDVYDFDEIEDSAIELFHNKEYDNTQNVKSMIERFSNLDCWKTNKRTPRRRP